MRSFAARVIGYAPEYGAALFWELCFAWHALPGAVLSEVRPERGRPPHDGERWSVRVADVVISTNDSYRRMAVQRDGKDPSAKAALSLQLNKTDQNDARGLAQIVRTGW